MKQDTSEFMLNLMSLTPLPFSA